MRFKWMSTSEGDSSTSVKSNPIENSSEDEHLPFEFVWRVGNWENKGEQTESPKLIISGLLFSMKLVVPEKTNQLIAVKVVLEQKPPGPKIMQFQVTLKNSNPGKSIVKRTSRAYSRANAYESFMLTQLKNIKDGEGFLDNGEIVIILQRLINKGCKPITNLSNSKSVVDHYDPKPKLLSPPPVIPPQQPPQSSKELTGCVGLKNQGATCYMNSLLQSLFHICAFRRLVYSIPTTGTENVEKSIPLNLQRLFCQLQLSDRPVSTSDLTKSFGWKRKDTMQQQDVQEFCRILIQNLEEKLKNTDMESSIDNIFRGHTKTVIKCKNVDCKNEILEDFKDLSLVVKGCKNLNESLMRELETQVLEGSSMYETEKYGKQEAVMGEEFADFPSVLHIHLRRFARDFDRKVCVKINDRFEFPAEIDLDGFYAHNGDNSKSNIYDLYGVLVHSGGSMCGHYYAYLRISLDPQWYRFDDQNVTKVSASEAIENNYGGKENDHDKTYSGYMLIYVRREDAPAIFDSIPDENVPQHLLDYFNSSKISHEGEQGPLELRISTENTLQQNSLNWVAGFDSTTYTNTINVTREMSIENLYNNVATTVNKNPRRIRLWKCGLYSIPTDIIPKSEEKAKSLLNNGSLVFCQDIDESEELLLEKGRMTVFLKFFFQTDNPSIQYIGAMYPTSNDTIEFLAEEVNKRVGLPKGIPLLCFQETIQKTAQLISARTLGEAGINTGVILVFQIVPGSEAPEPTIERVRKTNGIEVSRSVSIGDFGEVSCIHYADIYPECKPITVDQYIEYKLRMMKVVICSVVTPNSPSIILKFPSNLRWAAVKQFIASALQLNYQPESDSMRLFRRDPVTNTPMKTPINSKLTPSMRSVLACSSSTQNSKEKPWIYYQIFPGIPETAVNSMINYKVQFSTDSVTVDTSTTLLMPKTSTVQEIANEMANRFLIPRSNNLRAMPVLYHRIISILDFSQVPPRSEAAIRFEVIPIEQVAPKSGEYLISVVRGYLNRFDLPRLVSDPFLYQIKETDSINSIRAKLLEWADVKEQVRDYVNIIVLEDKRIVKEFEDDTPLYSIINTCVLMIVEDKPKPQILRTPSSKSMGSLRIFN